MPQRSSAKVRRLTRKEVRELDIKIGFMEGLIQRDPGYVEALQILGDYYTQRGLYDRSLQVDQQLSRLQPRDPLVFYNLACSYSLTGEFGLAVASLDRALSLGYRDFNWLSRDPDLRGLRKHPVYQSIRDRIRRMKGASSEPKFPA